MMNSASDINKAASAALDCLAWTEDDRLAEIYGITSENLEWSRNAWANMWTEVYDLMDTLTEEVTEGENEEWQKLLDRMAPGQFGHDFLLTRNGHGAGFWDRGLGEFGDYLSNMTRPSGSVYAFVNENGELDFE